MTTANKQGAGSQAAGQGAENKEEQPKAKKRHTGETKRAAQRKVGRRSAMKRTDLQTAADSSAAQYENGRAGYAGGRKSRTDGETNLLAFPLIRTVCIEHEVALAVRGFTKSVLKGAELNADRLSVIIEVESLSATTPQTEQMLGRAAFVGQCRDAIVRVLPGPANAEARAAFGFGEQVRAEDPPTIKRGAQKLLAGKKSMPQSRAARLLTADDEKQLKAIVKAIQTSTTQRKQRRKEGVSRNAEREILNAALELFYDDYAASISLVLRGDDLARVAALELIPRRPERREVSEEGTGGDTGGDTSTGQAPAAPVTQAATAKA